MATIVTYSGDVFGAIGDVQVQGTIGRYPNARMLRRRQPRGGEASPDQVIERALFTDAQGLLAAWADALSLDPFGLFDHPRHGPNNVRQWALWQLADRNFSYYSKPVGPNLFPHYPRIGYQGAGGPSQIWLRGTLDFTDPLITNAAVSCLGFNWSDVARPRTELFIFTAAFIQPTFTIRENVGYSASWNPTLFVLTGTKHGRRISSGLSPVTLRSDG